MDLLSRQKIKQGLAMKFKFLFVIFSIMITACDGSSLPEEAVMVDVYIHKGDTQCNNDGLLLSETTSYLIDSSIEVSSSQCAVLTGISTADVCGGNTLNIYVHTIKAIELIEAENLGFIDTSSFSASELGYAIIECPEA
jgi:hypothetical protein